MARLPNLGPRGEGWVAMQLVLIAAVVGLAFTGVYWPSGVAGTVTVLGLVLLVAGFLLLAFALVSLGAALTLFPRPRERGVVERGAYRFVRHPIYGAVILLAIGWSCAESPIALVATAALAVLLDLKARREEAWLEERYPRYGDYRERTGWRFVPFLY